MFLLFIFILLIGFCVGSFLNVLIYRLPRGLSVIFGRSFCPKCRKKISWCDNIPLLSFAVLRGHCRFCRSPISSRYPVVELLTGVLFVLGSFPYLGDLGNLSYLGIVEVGLSWVLFSALIVIFFIDLEHQIIPDEILLPLIFLFFLYRLLFSLFPTSHPHFSTQFPLLILTSFLSFFLSALLSFLFLYLIFLLTKGKGMGFGDVKLAFLMGLVLGYPKIIVAFYLAFLTGAFLGLILVIVKKVKFGQKVPFGPFLVWGTVVAFLWGEEILNIAGKILF